TGPPPCGPRRRRDPSPLAARAAEEATKALEALVDALQRRGVREPEIALRVGAEGRAGGDGDGTRLEEGAGEGDRVRREVPRIRQHVERAGRLGADAEAEGLEAGDHRAAPIVEDRAEAPAVVARLAQRGDAGPLHELVGRDEEVAVERLQRPDV